jgi:hypothetical protein
MTKKKRILLVLSVCLLAVVLLLAFGDRKTVNPFPIRRGEVERIELKTYSHTYLPGNKQAELSRAEANKIIRLINWSGYDPQITGEPCCDTYWLEVYLKDGTMIRVSQGNRENMTVKPVEGERYWVHNRALVRYVLKLVEAYDLVRD